MEVSALGIAVWIEVKGAGKGAFNYYVRVFWGFFKPPIYLMALPVMEFQDQGFKIRKIFA